MGDVVLESGELKLKVLYGIIWFLLYLVYIVVVVGKVFVWFRLCVNVGGDYSFSYLGFWL